MDWHSSLFVSDAIAAAECASAGTADESRPEHRPRPCTATLADEDLDKAKGYLEKYEEQGATDYEDWHKVRCCLQRGEDHAFTDSQLLYYFVGDDPDRSKSLTKALRFQIT